MKLPVFVDRNMRQLVKLKIEQVQAKNQFSFNSEDWELIKITNGKKLKKESKELKNSLKVFQKSTNFFLRSIILNPLKTKRKSQRETRLLNLLKQFKSQSFRP